MTTAHALSRGRKAEGLYDPAFEHDACGVAFVATLTGIASHDIIVQGLKALRNLDHRGATGADPKTGEAARRVISAGYSILVRGKSIGPCVGSVG